MNERQPKNLHFLASPLAPTGKEAEETLQALVMGDADAIVVDGKDGPRVYTLKDANEPYRHLVERMSEAAVVLEPDGTILYCNGRMAAMLGRDGLIGHNLLDLVVDEHRSRVETLLTAGSMTHTTAEIALLWAGATTLVRASAAPLIFDERPCVALLMTALGDIAALTASKAALRDSEARLRLMQEAAGVGSWEMDLTTGIAVWSPTHFALHGLDPRECWPSYDAWRAAIYPDDAERADAAVQAGIASGKGFETDYRIVLADGTVRWLICRGQVETDAAGQAARVRGFSLDITARKQAEEALKSAKAEAERANNAKSRFLAAASHDLRQPLSALNLYIDVLARKVAAVDRPLVDNMKNCAGSLSELLTDLLDLSKLDAGVVRPNVSSFPLDEMMANLVSVHAPEARVKGLRLRCVDSRLTARTDPVLLQRMLGNLLSNALRYTERGGVLIGSRRRQGKLWIEVWDTGIGIPDDKTGEIFEEFKQLGDDARTRGSGLGLAIVGRTAALLALKIRVSSRLGRGSMFAIEVPLGAEQQKPPAMDVAPRSLRIALVEDNDLVRQALTSALTAAGHEVIEAPTRMALLARIGGDRPDLVLSDYRLTGGETGFDVIAAVRDAFGDALPAILLTGDTDPMLMRSMADRGIVLQHKPVDLAALLTCLSALMKDCTLPAMDQDLSLT